MKKVLVVDDEAVLADTLAIILRTAGYGAAVAYSAADALELVTKEPPDLVISDVVMPGMNGIELAVRLGAAHPRCMVLLISGNANVDNLLETASRQGYSFELLAKPFHPKQLLARIEELFSRRAKLRAVA